MDTDYQIEETEDEGHSLSEGAIFISLIGILTIVGIIMVYSSSYLLAKDVYGNSAHFFLRQLTFLGISCLAGLIISKTKYTFWLKFGYGINIALALVLAMTFIPGLGVTVKGASRWLYLGGYSFQPGEVAKYVSLLGAIGYFENFGSYTRNQKLAYAGILLAPLVMILLQPDYGTFMICCIGLFFTCYMSSFPRKIFYGLIPIGVLAAGALLVAQPYRVERLKTFLDPWQSPQGSGFQIIQSWMGFANGSFFGKGLGNSNEKLFYLPEAHNDFILSVIGEETGFVGVFFLVCLFLGLIYYGFKLATKVKNREGALLVSGIVFIIGIQALLNMAVVLGLLPTKGLNLPFISYGGSSLLANYFALGLLFSVVRGSSDSLPKEDSAQPERPEINPELQARLQRFREQRAQWSRAGQAPTSRL